MTAEARNWGLHFAVGGEVRKDGAWSGRMSQELMVGGE